MKPADFGLLFVVCLVWALNLVITRWTVSVADVPPIFFAGVRLGLVGLVLAPFLFPAPRQIGHLPWLHSRWPVSRQSGSRGSSGGSSSCDLPVQRLRSRRAPQRRSPLSATDVARNRSAVAAPDHSCRSSPRSSAPPASPCVFPYVGSQVRHVPWRPGRSR